MEQKKIVQQSFNDGFTQTPTSSESRKAAALDLLPCKDYYFHLSRVYANSSIVSDES